VLALHRLVGRDRFEFADWLSRMSASWLIKALNVSELFEIYE
jgi:hypothetical protein